MAITRFPVIDPVATGANITRLRREHGFTVRDLQRFFGFEEPQAIYKWQRGQSLPSIDNLYALSTLLHISMNEILVSSSHIDSLEQQASACCSNHITAVFSRVQGVWQNFSTTQALIRPAPAAPLHQTAEGDMRHSGRLFLSRPSGRSEKEWRRIYGFGL
ncbi:helix-turn-helix domain-containing protein [Intestinimonas sp. HCP28S3_D6]|uniref:helix-turn-helix domain-containing protein n=1 Tax=Intestinimonas sp. HCP28S3_D6 TaxID=3438942 RepID=UPI003F88C9E5